MQASTIGLDIAKNVFQVHGIDAAEKVVVRKQLRRSDVWGDREYRGLSGRVGKDLRRARLTQRPESTGMRSLVP